MREKSGVRCQLFYFSRINAPGNLVIYRQKTIENTFSSRKHVFLEISSKKRRKPLDFGKSMPELSEESLFSGFHRSEGRKIDFQTIFSKKRRLGQLFSGLEGRNPVSETRFQNLR